MFTGLIEDVGIIEEIQGRANQAFLTVSTRLPMKELSLGESIAVNGICLTVKQFGHGRFSADASPETMDKTTLGRLTRGAKVNLERAMKLSDRLGGHLVTGHIDGRASIVGKHDDANAWRFRFKVDAALLPMLVSKGSVAVDGISLTVNDVTEESFSVAIIPHTLENTTLADRQVGDLVNIETDIIAKYVARLLAAKNTRTDAGVSLDLLAKHGFL